MKAERKHDEREVAIATFNSVRAEITTRIQLRDQALTVYIGLVGAVLALSFVREGLGPATLLAIPFLSFGMTYLVETHHSMIGELSRYLATDWTQDMASLLDGRRPPIWDGSVHGQGVQDRAIRERTVAHSLILVAPPVLILALNAGGLSLEGSQIAWEWLLGVATTVLTAGLLLRSHRARSRAATEVAAARGQ